MFWGYGLFVMAVPQFYARGTQSTLRQTSPFEVTF